MRLISSSALALLLVLITAGCGGFVHHKSLQFQLVDGATGLPLEGVQTARHSDPGNFYRNHDPEHVTYPPTGSDGTVFVKSLSSDFSHVLLFSKPGYELAGADIGTKQDAVSVNSPVPMAPTYSDFTVPPEGTIVIRMYRVGTTRPAHLIEPRSRDKPAPR